MTGALRSLEDRVDRGLGRVELGSEAALVADARRETALGLRDVAFDVPDRVQHALPAVHRLVAVAQLDGLELARRGTRRHSRASERPGLELRFDLDRGVAARIENLARMDSGDRGSG